MAKKEAKWKAEYRAFVSRLTNAELLSEVMEQKSINGDDRSDDRDLFKCGVSESALIDRLTASGLLPADGRFGTTAATDAPAG